MYVYQAIKSNQISIAVEEHALVIAEPMWNFDDDVINDYITAVMSRYDYEVLRVFNYDDDLFLEVKSQEQSFLSAAFEKIHLITKTTFTTDIIHDEKTIGQIEVIWRNTAVYVYSYALLVAILLVIITNLYSKIVVANLDLEKKIIDTQKAMQKVQQQKEYIEEIFNAVPQGLITLDGNGQVLRWNRYIDDMLGKWADRANEEAEILRTAAFTSLFDELKKSPAGQYLLPVGNQSLHIDYSSSDVPSLQKAERVISLKDMTDIAAMERQLAQAQKLESVGRLAAGIAHEINTPTQYVNTNIDFLAESHKDITSIMQVVNKLLSETDQRKWSSLLDSLREEIEEIDWKYLEGEIPVAIEQSQEGLHRIRTIVTAMKRFSHPSGAEKEEMDLNAAIESTVTIARNEWKYIAKMNLELDPDLPTIRCYLDQLNQVILIMIINGAHAIEERNKGNESIKGQITIKTLRIDNHIRISISDTGIGIPEDVKEKIFDPFFTTKDINKGSGQGLAIARDIIVDKHKGMIEIESVPGNGTTFNLILPIT